MENTENKEQQQNSGQAESTCSIALVACAAIIDCDKAKLSAQMSGFKTGWECPGTLALFKKAYKLAIMALQEQ